MTKNKKRKHSPEGALIMQNNNITTNEKSKRKRIEGYEDYFIYEDGRIFSTKSDKFLKHNISSCGYPSVELFNNEGSARKTIHRLVAEAFIPNPNNYPQINHIDENKLNPSVENLEWCTAKYNMNYGEGARTRHSKIDYSKPIYKENAIKNGKKASKPVLMFTLEGELVARFESAAEASRQTGIYVSTISRAVKTKYNAGGFAWRFA